MKNNKYGYPNYNVLKNLTDSIVYKTNSNGSLMFRTIDKNI